MPLLFLCLQSGIQICSVCLNWRAPCSIQLEIILIFFAQPRLNQALFSIRLKLVVATCFLVFFNSGDTVMIGFCFL